MQEPKVTPLEVTALADPELMAAVREARNDRLLTPAQVAELFSVTPRTVTRWAKIGVLVAVRPNPRGQRWYRESQVRALLNPEDN